MRPSTSPSIAVLRAVSVLWLLGVCPPSALLGLCAATWEGRAFALSVFCLGIAPFLCAMGVRAGRWRLVGGGVLALAAGLICWLLVSTPDGHAREGARVSNRYTGGGWRRHGFALGSYLPEVDQLLLGFKLMPAADPFFNLAQSRQLSALTREIYGELEADRDFHALGSSMPEVYDDLLGLKFLRGHYYLYVPLKLNSSKPAPALIFLHGFGGNFKAYTWIFSRIAEELGMVLIVPSYGQGMWDAGGPDAVRAALEDAARMVPIDGENMHLMGLSNGGLGLCQWAASPWGGRFRSMIFLSPAFDNASMRSSAFQTHWRGKPALVLSGADDDRIPISYVREMSGRLKDLGASVEMKSYAGANHFLVFSHRQAMLTEVMAWLRLHAAG